MVASIRPVKAVLFDMTGTLHSQVQIGRAAALNCAHMADSVGVSADGLFAAMREAMGREMSRYADKAFYLVSEIYQQAYPAALSQMGAAFTETLVDGFIEDFRQQAAASVSPQDGAMEVLEEFRAADITMGIVSVNDERDLQMLVEACGFREFFDFILSSEAARSCKPDQGTFRQAIELSGRAADETIFVGDTPEMDSRGANRAGMRTVLTTQDRLRPESRRERPRRPAGLHNFPSARALATDLRLAERSSSWRPHECALVCSAPSSSA